MQKLKLRKVGGSVGVILPKEVLDNLRLSDGDEVFIEANQTGINLSPLDPDFEATMDAFERTRKKYRNAFRELAK